MIHKYQLIVVICLLALLSACEPVNIDLSPGNSSENASSVDIEPNPVDENESNSSQRSDDLIPDGVLVSTENENSIIFLDQNGALLREIETPGIAVIDPEDVVIAGAIDPNGEFPPVLYHSWQPNQAIMVNNNGQIDTVREFDNILAMTGATGKSAIAFSEVLINEDNFPHGFLYAATVDNLSTAPAFYDLVDEPFYWALKPVGIKTVGGEIQGVWYVKTAWGIGGADLIFPINRGLFFFDLTNGDNLQYMDDGRNLQGISPDLTYAALVDSDNSSDKSLSIINLGNNTSLQFPLDPASDRGAGWAVFSPDNHYAAWLEASGSLISDPFDFQPRIRVGDIETGSVVLTIENTTAAQIINGDMVSMMRPAGWLDNESLLIEVRGKDWGDVSLLRFDINSGTISNFSAGSFLSFGYQ